MNHFELFSLPVELDIDLAVLKNEFLKLQQQYHPDKAEDKDQAQQQEAKEIDHTRRVLVEAIVNARHYQHHNQPQQGIDCLTKDHVIPQRGCRAGRVQRGAVYHGQTDADQDERIG